MAKKAAKKEKILSGSQQITPVLIYSDIVAAHAFLVETFGFDAGALVRSGDEVVHGEVHINGETIWLHRETTEHSLASPGSQPSASSGLAVLVDDVDSHYERVRAAGAVTDGAPQDQPYGRREYGTRDLDGHRWWFGTES